MRDSLGGLAAVVLGALVYGDASAQEVRRAIPVDPRDKTPVNLDEYQNPGWMNQVRPSPTPSSVQTPSSEIPAPPSAEPVATPEPVSSPAPQPQNSPRLQSESPPAVSPKPEPAPQVEQPLEEPESEGTVIRVAPGSEAERLLEAADGFYARRMYDLAVPEYERFLIRFPERGTPGRDRALFRLAECHRALENDLAARENYERLLREFERGEFVGAAAFRMAETLYGEQRYHGALANFRLAAENAKDEDVRLTARYYEARCQENIGRKKEAFEIYEQIAAKEGENPFREFAMLALANRAQEENDPDEALKRYREVSEVARRQPVRAEAMVKAGEILYKRGDKAEALELFQKAATLPEAGEWAAAGKLGALRGAYEDNDYEAVLAQADKTLENLPREARAEALMIVANSQRQLEKFPEARVTYEQIIQDFPSSEHARAARFQRLVCLYSSNDENTIAEIDAFLQRTADPKERNQANLLKAEKLLAEERYEEAARLYDALQPAEFADHIKKDIAYKLGWCHARAGNNVAAALAYGRFAEGYPDDKRAPTAVVQKGMALQREGKLQEALAEYDILIDKYADSRERELALQQKAIVLGQQQKMKEMRETFEQLLKEYPETAAAGQANFWLGWADFEEKNYAAAVEKLEKARELDAANYGQRATLRLLMAQYYLENRDGVAAELERIEQANVPPEILLWLGRRYLDDGESKKALSVLKRLAGSEHIAAYPEAYLLLARAQVGEKEWAGALENTDAYLKTARDPVTRADGLLVRAYAMEGLGRYDDATALAEETMLLQPEGQRNADARILLADILAAKGRSEEAARAYMTVALLYEDSEITPRALRRAADAFRKAGLKVEAEKALKNLQARFPEDSTASAQTASGD